MCRVDDASAPCAAHAIRMVSSPNAWTQVTLVASFMSPSKSTVWSACVTTLVFSRLIGSISDTYRSTLIDETLLLAVTVRWRRPPRVTGSRKSGRFARRRWRAASSMCVVIRVFPSSDNATVTSLPCFINTTIGVGFPFIEGTSGATARRLVIGMAGLAETDN